MVSFSLAENQAVSENLSSVTDEIGWPNWTSHAGKEANSPVLLPSVLFRPSTNVPTHIEEGTDSDVSIILKSTDTTEISSKISRHPVNQVELTRQKC